MPALPVDIVLLTPKPVEQTSDLVGTIKSRRTTTIQPMVQGILTKIAVTSGQHVEAGTVLFEVDAKPQEAAVSSLEQVRTAREADVAFAKQQADRAKKLLEVGAGSQADYEQATTQLKTAEAQLRAIDEQIKQMRTELAWYHVTASTAGTVGDIPVRQGDRVTPATELTTVEDRAGLEAYINVPVQQARGLKVGLPLRLLDDGGKVVANERIAFVSPSVDDATQTVLVKSTVSPGAGFRADQFVRARVVWSTDPGLTVPLTAVVRVNGQYFAFIAADGPTPGSLVAKQRPVTLGAVLGNEYLLLGGLNAGEKLIVSGLQKIGDGAPVQARPAGPPQTPAPGRSGGH